MNLLKMLLFFLLSTNLYSKSKNKKLVSYTISHKELSKTKAQKLHDNYLSMDINYMPIKKLFADLNRNYQIKYNRKLKNRGEAHITVITPPEYDVLKKHISMVELQQIAQNNKIQTSKIEVICIGRSQKSINKTIESTFYLVVKSKNLLTIREQIERLYIKRSKSGKLFSAALYNPHITLGFSKRDLYSSDGAIKNNKSCIKEQLKVN